MTVIPSGVSAEGSTTASETLGGAIDVAGKLPAQEGAALLESAKHAFDSGSGTVAMVSVKASAAEQAAAVKWIDFYYLSKLTDQEQAVRDAKTLAASKQRLTGLAPNCYCTHLRDQS